MSKDLNKKIRVVFILGLIAAVIISIVVIGMAIRNRTDYATQTQKQIENQTFLEKNTIMLNLPIGNWYLDKRMNYLDNCVSLCGEMGWIYDCKLYRDFSCYQYAYMVYSSVKFIRTERKNDKVMAYYTKAKNNDRYIFIWETTDSSILHELAHFADDIQNDISQSDEWNAIYEEEWEDNEWLKGYEDDKLSIEEQECLYRKESFAEAFAEWYVYTYELEYFKDNTDENRLSHIIMTGGGAGTAIETHPKTYQYMEEYYNNYPFSEDYYMAVKYGQITIK